jgi:hypothetical protein
MEESLAITLVLTVINVEREDYPNFSIAPAQIVMMILIFASVALDKS